MGTRLKEISVKLKAVLPAKETTPKYLSLVNSPKPLKELQFRRYIKICN